MSGDPILSKWAEVTAEVAVLEKKLVPNYGRLKALLLELVGMMVQRLTELEKKRDG